MDWIWILLIGCLVYIGIDYGCMVYKTKCRQTVIEYTPYTPIRHIFIAQGDNSMAEDLFEASIQAHCKAGYKIETERAHVDQKTTYIVWDNGDEELIYFYGTSPIDQLAPAQIKEYEHKLFFDSDLPIGAERAVIKALGLEDYMIQVGICKGGK